jgi:hypothetical protein
MILPRMQEKQPVVSFRLSKEGAYHGSGKRLA